MDIVTKTLIQILSKKLTFILLCCKRFLNWSVAPTEKTLMVIEKYYYDFTCESASGSSCNELSESSAAVKANNEESSLKRYANDFHQFILILGLMYII